MAIASRLPASTAAPVPRWVDRAAHVMPWTTVPSGLWRIALGFGVPVGFTGDPEAPHGFAGLVMVACYAPLLAWGPLLAVVTVAYAVRRRRSRRQP